MVFYGLYFIYFDKRIIIHYKKYNIIYMNNNIN